ncbi:heterocyst-inhibiting protein PatX [Microcoleus sp. S13_B4]|uniref:heterocyst-inhibiting protein PatX n=1 Tax=Microcoleus sp. S13_B4 TaxID=3055408 RepID=UPI002FD48D2D
MMRVYSSILMSSLLLSGTAVNAQSLETRSTFFDQDNPTPDILTTLAGTPTFDADTGKDEPPPRGAGR